LLPIPMELAPPMSALYFILVTLDCYCFVLLLLFCLFWDFLYFYSFSLSYARLVVRTWRDLAPLIRFIFFWGVTHLVWRWNSIGLFTTHSAYTWMMYRGVVVQNCTIWWVLHVPLKIKVFMWLVGKNFF
jgi:hypothetical protein